MSADRKSIGWFLAGLGLGAGVAILYAPKSGRETRKMIAAGVNEGAEHLTAMGHDARDQVSGWVESGKDFVGEKKAELNAALDKGKEQISSAVNAGRKVIHKATA